MPCELIVDQISEWLEGIQIEEEHLPDIQATYREEVHQAVSENKSEKASSLKRRISQLDDEEARLGRLFMTGKISEKIYERLHAEWQEKATHAKVNLRKVEQDTTIHVSNLDMALVLMASMFALYQRFDEKMKCKLLSILVKRIIVNPQGEIVGHQLHSPFEYLKNIELRFTPKTPINRSEQVMLGVFFLKNQCFDY